MKDYKYERLKSLKKVLLSKRGTIRLGQHAKERLELRGYSRADVISAIMTGTIHEVQWGYNHYVKRSCPSMVVTGFDMDQNPIVVIISEESSTEFSVITVMPPKDHFRFKDCI